MLAVSKASLVLTSQTLHRAFTIARLTFNKTKSDSWPTVPWRPLVCLLSHPEILFEHDQLALL